MVSKDQMPLKNAVKNLEMAILEYDKKQENDPLPFLAATKAFEVAVEYGWRELKRKVEDEGLEVLSPKSAVKQAAKVGIISDPELWLLAIDARNNSVHDYFGLSEKEFVELAKKFIVLARSA